MRIRQIKPEFWKHVGLGEISDLARLLFIGLWSMADCAGRLKDQAKLIKAELFTYSTQVDVDAIESMLNELDSHDEKFIVRYEVDGKRYIQVSNFKEHQHLMGNESKGISKYPEPINNNEYVSVRTSTSYSNNHTDIRSNGYTDNGVSESDKNSKNDLPEEFHKAIELTHKIAGSSLVNQKSKWAEDLLQVSFSTTMPKDLNPSQVLECWAETLDHWGKSDAYLKTTFKNKMAEYHTKQKKGSFTKPVAAAPSQAQLDKQHREYYNLDRLDAYLAAEVLISTAYEGLTISGKDLVIKGIDQLAFNKDIVMGDRTYYRAGTELCWTIWLTPEALERRNQAWKSLTA